jgi:zinc D-Ala-D-Ala carboxypeptidase
MAIPFHRVAVRVGNYYFVTDSRGSRVRQYLVAPSRINDPLAPTPVFSFRQRGQRAQAQRRAWRQSWDALGISSAELRRRRLKTQLEPHCLVALDDGEKSFWLTPAAARATLQLLAAAQRVGVDLCVLSAFRSSGYQAQLIENKLRAGQTVQQIMSVNAAPGFSEHHRGRAIDLAMQDDRRLTADFEQTPGFAWLIANAARFGFRLSFPRDNWQGYIYEPWHWYYVGRKAR